MRRALFALIAALPLLAAGKGKADPDCLWRHAPRVADYGGATLPTGSWFTPMDYPTDALRKELQGRVVVAFDITAEGKATNCAAEPGAFASAFGRAACRALEKRARFDPARVDGVPVSTKGRASLDLWIPGVDGC